MSDLAYLRRVAEEAALWQDEWDSRTEDESAVGRYLDAIDPRAEVADTASLADSLKRSYTPTYTPCPVCPHWMEMHDPDGTCGCGAHG